MLSTIHLFISYYILFYYCLADRFYRILPNLIFDYYLLSKTDISLVFICRTDTNKIDKYFVLLAVSSFRWRKRNLTYIFIYICSSLVSSLLSFINIKIYLNADSFSIFAVEFISNVLKIQYYG